MLFALFLIFAILERMGGWLALLSGAVLFIGIFNQYRTDYAKIQASEAIKQSKA
ncbi:MAG: hypothetical protein ABJP79_16810 [Tateyamaria sp.]|uniref:hypothetical protein n=1 Tax=Tateyamaria sp. TaxID=1929288 RepID=UPI00329D805E